MKTQSSMLFYWLFALLWGLILIGVMLITSVSVFESYQIELVRHSVEYCQENNCNGFYLWRHVRHVFLGMIVFIFAIFCPIIFWRRLALPLFFGSLLLLIALLVSSIGGDWGTAKSWINISFLPSIQPSEMMKVAMIFYLAIWMDKKEHVIQTWENGFFPFVLLMLPPVFLLALQPDFGSLLVIAAIAGVMFFVAGGNMWHILLGVLLAGFVIFLPIILSDCSGEGGAGRGKFCYISDRIFVFLEGDVDEHTDENRQVRQSLIGIGSGRLLGVGIGESGQGHGWIPEVQSDMIFAAAGEELGFFRMILFVLAFALLAILGLQVAQNAQNRFDTLVASGVSAWIGFQAIINMAVVTQLFPVTGITLPFVSYGGSSLLTLLFSAGVLLHIARFSSSHEHRFSLGRIRGAHHSRTRRRF